MDDTNDEQVENNDLLTSTDYRYQIVNSSLPRNGDYQIDNRMYYVFSFKYN